MQSHRIQWVFWGCLTAALLASDRSLAQELRIPLAADMLQSSSPRADFDGLVDEQQIAGDPPSGKPQRGWAIPSQFWKDFPYAVTVDLGQTRNLSALWLFDTNGVGELEIAVGEPGAWRALGRHKTDTYLRWSRIPLDTTTRWLRLQLLSPGANFAEIMLYAYTPAAHQAMLARKAAEARERAARDAALEVARRELAAEPWVELPPFGRVRLVDQIDCGREDPGHQFRESPAGSSRVRTILGRPCRELPPVAGEASYLAFRIGKCRLLKPGKAYVLAIDYPEDAPRSMIVRNGGNETSRGFHTGTTIGDALHPKYVRNNPESLKLPLSGRHETWSLLFHLHDRFPDLGFPRGAGPRPLVPEDGFDVSIAQFSARNDPTSRGIAVSRVRLFEVPDAAQLCLPLELPPDPLPRRRIFWREEMADGVIQSDDPQQRGVQQRLVWYDFKAAQMRFLGINTFSKDLLEFGACQHWDSTPHGGNQWVFFDRNTKDLWPQIVQRMGTAGFEILPYYEYAGSKGYQGLGNQRRCRPLSRDDAYTHIRWIESANADITDPDTYRDFQKMLDLTVVRLRDQAAFAGIWLRPRGQLPMSFADAARERFVEQTGVDGPVSREDLIQDPDLLQRYEAWWFDKRREFLLAMRDYLAGHGIADPQILFTADASEPGKPFPSWDKWLVTDEVENWRRILDDPRHVVDDRPTAPVPLQRVVDQDWQRDALLSAPLNWGDWEVQHSNPPADPQRYKETPGILMTHGFHRAYTTGSPRSLESFRAPSGLALVRHYALNENMLFDRQDQPKLGYFVADIERAGPFCMLAEALAVANGDPTWIGYLCGNNYGRGFPQYVRGFHAAFLALPALPSRRLPQASTDPEVVVREITTDAHGAWYAVVNTGWQAKRGIPLKLPAGGPVQDLLSGAELPIEQGRLQLDLHPCQLRALRAR